MCGEWWASEEGVVSKLLLFSEVASEAGPAGDWWGPPRLGFNFLGTAGESEVGSVRLLCLR